MIRLTGSPNLNELGVDELNHIAEVSHRFELWAAETGEDVRVIAAAAIVAVVRQLSHTLSAPEMLSFIEMGLNAGVAGVVSETLAAGRAYPSEPRKS